MISIKRIKNTDEIGDAFYVRTKVFVREQHVPLEIEIDEYDKTAEHVIAYLEDKPIGCGRLILNGKKARIGRVAVLKENRRCGIGKKICVELMNIALEKGAEDIVLDAQITAVGFYKKLGFAEAGEKFMEAGIEHIQMKKSLNGGA
ncbi:MAG: GNAT family N-acetyltransferase [Clostridiaceae bacterium]|nr:GNAT family N-acetyltransferase [Clostridiaceae bacterium]